MRQQDLKFLHTKKIAKASKGMRGRAISTAQITVELGPVYFQSAAHFSYGTVVAAQQTQISYEVMLHKTVLRSDSGNTQY